MARPENGPEFNLHELVHWLQMAEMRYGGDDREVTAKRSGTAIAIFQNGKFRASVDLDTDRPILSFADDEA